MPLLTLLRTQALKFADRLDLRAADSTQWDIIFDWADTTMCAFLRANRSEEANDGWVRRHKPVVKLV